jgi:tape measure domain-containing protein
MRSVLDRLVLQMALENRTKAGLKAMEGDFDGTLRRIQRSATLTERSLANVGKNFGQNININRVLSAGRAFDQVNQRAGLLRGTLFATTAALGGFGAALGSNVFARYADTFTQINNQIRPLTKDSAELALRFDAVSKVSDRSRSGLRETATLYARIQKSLPNLDVGKTLEVTETIQKALQLGGATTQEAASAAIQFSQALSSNRLGGEELRTILETPLGSALAKGLGVSLGELRKLSIEGKLTAKVLIDALGKIGPDVEKQFGASIRTLDQALVQADNRLTEYVGQVNDSYGATKVFGDAILGLANNLELLGRIAGPAALAAGAVFAGRLAGGSAKGGVLGKAGGAAAGLYSLGSGAVAKGANTIAKAELTEATDRLAKATAQVAKLKELSRDDVLSEFAGSENGAVEKSRRELEKLDAQRLAQNDKFVKAQKTLADVTNVTSKQQIAQTNRAIEAEKKLASIQDQRLRAVNALKFNPNYEDAQKQLAKADADLPKAQAAATQRAALVSAAAAKADGKVAQDRMKALREIATIERDIARLDEKRQIGSKNTLGLVEARDVVAAKGYSEELLRLNARAGSFTATLIKTEAYVEGTAKAMTRAGRTSAVFGKAVSGTIGFLGGPFGAAVTALVVGLELYGIAAAKSAADTDKVNRMIAELGIVAGGSASNVTKLGESFAGLKASKIRDEIELAKKEIEKITVGGGFFERGFALSGPSAQTVANDARDIRIFDSGLVKNGNREAASEVQRIALVLRDTPEKADELRVALDKVAKLKLSGPLNDAVQTLEVLIDRADTANQLLGIKKQQLNPVFSSTTQGAAAADAQNRLQRGIDDAKAVVDNTIATAVQTEQEKRLVEAIEKLRADLGTKGLEGAFDEAGYRQQAIKIISAQDGAKALESAVSLIKQFEGKLLTEARFDTNAPRVGFSSDTKTAADGSVSPVKYGDTSTLDEANRDLYRRAAESLVNIREQIGAAVFDTMSENQKAVLSSIGYNYSNKGLLPKGIAGAARTGDIAGTAQAIRDFGRTPSNKGKNLSGRYDNSAENFLSGDAVASKLDARRQDFKKLIADSEASTRAVEAETAAIGKNVYQKTLAVETEKLMSEATKDGQKLSEAEIKAINAKAEARAKAESVKAQAEFTEKSSEDAKQKIADLEAEAAAYGKSAAEAAKAAYIKDQFAKADADGIDRTKKLTAEILANADAIALAAQTKAQAEFSSATEKDTEKKISGLQREASALGLTAIEAQTAAYAYELYAKATELGIEKSPATVASIDEQTAALRRQLEVNELLKDEQESYDKTRDSAKDAIKGFATDVRAGENAVDALTSAISRFANSLLDRGIDSLLDILLGGGKPGTPAGGGLLNTLIGGFLDGGSFGGLYAKGGHAPANSTIVVGEKGPELMRTGATGAYITPNNRLPEISKFASRRNYGSDSSGVVPISVQYHGEARPRVESARMSDGELIVVMHEVAQKTTMQGFKKAGFGRSMKQRP